MCVCVCLYTCVHMRACAFKFMRVCVRMCVMSVCVYACVYVCVCRRDAPVHDRYDVRHVTCV